MTAIAGLLKRFAITFLWKPFDHSSNDTLKEFWGKGDSLCCMKSSTASCYALFNQSKPFLKRKDTRDMAGAMADWKIHVVISSVFLGGPRFDPKPF